jgi:hypothetical protein
VAPPGVAGAVGFTGTGIGVGAVAAAASDAAGITPTAIAAPPTTAAFTSLFMSDCPFGIECASGARARRKLTMSASDVSAAKINLWTAELNVDNSIHERVTVKGDRV